MNGWPLAAGTERRPRSGPAMHGRVFWRAVATFIALEPNLLIRMRQNFGVAASLQLVIPPEERVTRLRMVIRTKLH